MGLKKNPEPGLGRVQVLSKKSETRPGYNPIFLKLPKNPPIYIAITNPKLPHFFSTQHQLTPPSPSLPHFSSLTLSRCLTHTASLTITQCLTLTQKHTHGHAYASPLSRLLSLFLKLSLPATLSTIDDFNWILGGLTSIPSAISTSKFGIFKATLRRFMQPSLNCTRHRSAYVARRH